MNNRKKIYWLKQEIKQLNEQIAEISNISSPNLENIGGGVHNNSSAVENYVLQLGALLDKLRLKQKELEEEVSRIENIIDNIEDAETRTICRMYYISNLSYRRIGERLHMNRMSVQRRVKMAVNDGD